MLRSVQVTRNTQPISRKIQHRSLMTQELKSNEINQVFGGVVDADNYVSESFKKLNQHGFTQENTLPCVSLCRDELTGPLLNSIDNQWRPESLSQHSNVFVLSGLAGMLFSGKTGLGAGFSHAPEGSDGVRRFVVYAFPHLGYNAHGEAGKVNRVGIEGETTCCGALAGIKNALDTNNNQLDDSMDFSDPEMSLLKRRLKQALDSGSQPPKSLAELTKLTHSMVAEDVEKNVKAVVSSSPHKFDYAVFTGVQIHGPGPKPENYVWPGNSYAVINGKKSSL